MTAHATAAQPKPEEHRHASLTAHVISTQNGKRNKSRNSAESELKERKTTFTAHTLLKRQHGITSAVHMVTKGGKPHDRLANHQML